MHRLSFLDPGHFHGALLLRETNPRVHPTIYVYAEVGPDLDAFLALVRGFNGRAESPTSWDIQIRAGDRPLDRLIAERAGDCVVYAGRNDRKLPALARLHEAGFAVALDKPWIVDGGGLDIIEAATAGPPAAMDIMTSHYDGLVRLRRLIVETPSVFGTIAGSPALEFESVHHLLKTVAGQPLRRPAWYYDTRLQGSGLVDIPSHMVDQAQALIAPDRAWDYGRDFVLDEARLWTTRVPLSLFRESTGEDGFPESLRDSVEGGVLALACNGEISYRLLGHEVRQRAIWEPREPEGGGDTMQITVRGSGAAVIMRQGPETGGKRELVLRPTDQDDLAERVRDALPGWRESFPELDVEPSDGGLKLLVPQNLMPPHEAHFALWLDYFLDAIETGPPPAVGAGNRARYTLLAKAHEMATTKIQ
jgi:predicted dehydrogenase